MSESEVARLRRQIELELEALQRGMHGFALGTARHTFICKRMNRVGVYQDKLMEQVGEEKANEIMYNIYAEAIK